jgi:methanogenic corrinoid protein MtbC1
VDRCIAAVNDLDAAALEEELAHAGAAVSRKRLLAEVIHPLMERIGELWAEGSLRVAHEHLAAAAVRSFLGSIQAADMAPETAPGIVLTTPAGQLHEIGALLAAAVAAAEGWRVTYLGPNLPAGEIAGAALQEQARVVGLSIVYPANAPHLEAELVRLRRALGPETAILAGGRAASRYQRALERVGATLVEKLADLPSYLAKVQEEAIRT